MEADSASEKTEGQSAGDQEGTKQAANSSLVRIPIDQTLGFVLCMQSF